MKTSARKSLAISITQSARIASRSKIKKSRKCYDLKYRSDKPNNLNPNLLVSQSQETNNNSNDVVAIVPRNLEEQFLNGLKRKSSQNSHISRDSKKKKSGEVNTSSPKQKSTSQHSLKLTVFKKKMILLTTVLHLLVMLKNYLLVVKSPLLLLLQEKNLIKTSTMGCLQVPMKIVLTICPLQNVKTHYLMQNMQVTQIR